MRTLTILLLTSPTMLLAATAARAETVVYVSVAAEKRVAVYQMDPATGKLTHRGDTKLDGEPGALTVDPGRPDPIPAATIGPFAPTRARISGDSP